MRAHHDSLAFKHRSAFELLTALNHKTPKGEAAGWFTATLYLAPHTSAGGATVCPHSTEACRAMCLAGAGMGALPRQVEAKLRRTKLFLDQRPAFLQVLAADVEHLRDLAEREGVKPALRLNGTSDILWERQDWNWSGLGVRRYDYTKVPLHLRRIDPGYHLTYSYTGPQDAARAVGYLDAGHSVAVVVPEEVKVQALARAGGPWPLIDGDAHDLRFLDPPGSIVLLKPKGRIVSALVRPAFAHELARAAHRVAA